ncbi:MAG TPA: hypothetical protein VK507_03075, partial [Iamia sp.]|nr:hypothetical protein [Iamia sp.]
MPSAADPSPSPAPLASDVRDGLLAAISRRRQGSSPDGAAVEAVLDVIATPRGEEWVVRVRPPGVDLLAGHQARGSVV